MKGTRVEMTQGSNDLDDLFAMAAQQRMAPSEALMTRVLADAMAEQPRAPRAQPMRPTVPNPGFWAQLAAVFGGGGALAGIGTAAVAGVVIGFAQPVGLGALTEAVWGTPLETVELIPSVETLFAEN
ncbi:MAG: hypothetical protein RLZZ563_463 [Pseudomonadota bacterium]